MEWNSGSVSMGYLEQKFWNGSIKIVSYELYKLKDQPTKQDVPTGATMAIWLWVKFDFHSTGEVMPTTVNLF